MTATITAKIETLFERASLRPINRVDGEGRGYQLADGIVANHKVEARIRDNGERRVVVTDPYSKNLGGQYFLTVDEAIAHIAE